MKQILKRIECFILAFILTVPIISNNVVSIVNASGYTKRDKTNVIIDRGSSNVSEYRCEVGVKTVDYLPETAENDSYLVGTNISAGNYIVFSDYTSTLGAFWEIDNFKGDDIIKNDFTKETAMITVSKGQRLVIHHGYAISMSAASQGMHKLGYLNKIILQNN